jgi:aquaporin related protein
MLEYETANPGQDAEREPFNPNMDSSQPQVSFAPEEYALEEGRAPNTASSTNTTFKSNENRALNGSADPTGGNIGTPKEYGAAQRPYSESPAPPNPNDQFAGLADGGMHANEFVQTERTPVTPTRTAMKAGTNASTSNMGAGHSVSSNTYNNRQMGDLSRREDI